MIGLVLSALAITLAAPDYRRFYPYPGVPWAQAAVNWQFSHPLEPIPVAEFAKSATPSESGIVEHLEKKSYRVAVPLASNLLRIGVQGALISQQIASYLLLVLTIIVARRFVIDDLSALMIGILFAASFVGQWGFNDFVYFDGIAYFTILLAIWSRSFLVVMTAIIFGGLTDERAVVATPLIYLCMLMTEPGKLENLSWEKLLRPNRLQLALVVGILGFVIFRLLLGYQLGNLASTSGIGISLVKGNALLFPLTFITVAKGACVIYALATLIAIVQGKLAWLAVVGLACIPGLGVTFLVYDMSRSLVYTFPLFFLAALAIRHHFNLSNLRRVLMIAAICCLLIPTYVVVFRQVSTLLPIIRFL